MPARLEPRATALLGFPFNKSSGPTLVSVRGSFDGLCLTGSNSLGFRFDTQAISFVLSTVVGKSSACVGVMIFSTNALSSMAGVLD
jgi:hypothetical protein